MAKKYRAVGVEIFPYVKVLLSILKDPWNLSIVENVPANNKSNLLTPRIRNLFTLLEK